MRSPRPLSPTPSDAAPARPKPWSLPVAIAMTALFIPGLFWYKFGRVDGYAVAAAAFLIILQLGLHFGLKRSAQFAHEKPPPYTPGPFDFLVVVWVVSIPISPFVGWALTNFIDLGVANWRVWLGVRAVLCVVLPIISVLPLLRFLRRPHVGFMLAFLGVGTAFPVVTGIGSAIDVVRGPRWENVEITSIKNVVKPGGKVLIRGALIELADGRRLTRTKSVNVREGPDRLLILRGIQRIIDAEREGPRPTD